MTVIQKWFIALCLPTIGVAAKEALIVKVKHPGTWNWTLSTRSTERIDPAFKTPSRYFVVWSDGSGSSTESKAALSKNPEVLSVTPDYELSDPGVMSEADPELEKQWYLKVTAVTGAWKYTTGKGTSISDIESGWDTQHPDLARQFDLQRSFDYDPFTSDPLKINDNIRSHGTQVAGILAMENDKDRFGVGIAYDTKIIGSQSDTTPKAFATEKLWTVGVARAILGSIQRKASVILIEKQVPALLSSVERVPIIYDAIQEAIKAGIPVIVPAGNFNRELKEEALLPDSGSILVGATSKNNDRWSLSNYGSRVDVVAPGEGLYTTNEMELETSTFGGTSGASAIVAAIVALIREANGSLSPSEIRELLRNTAKQLGDGTRLVQAESAVVKALGKE